MAPRDTGKASDDAARRRFVTLPLAQLVPGLTRAAFRKRSPASATLMADWAQIVGPALAAQTEPRKLTRGLLTLACSGAVAMELQHAAGSLIDRINTHAGEKLVERLRFTQDFVAAPPVRRRRRVAPVPVPDLADEGLNAALARLEAAIKARE